ncbi:MAG: peptidylprolyl isomerase [Taibaiella sp.]|nr:peptidylprolyl isomerase [Taibaiella sp.]
MRKLLLTCITLATICTTGFAQTLFTYGNTPVTKQEFLRIYEKNNINKKPDYSRAALKEYLDLYSLFRMKVSEAEAEKFDTITSVQRELDNYRRQLARNYLTDEQVNNRLIHEAYDRMREDVHIAHILISCRAGSDTVAAYHKIDSIYRVVTSKKAEFAEMARLYSDDKGTKDNGGDVGYMTALQTVYPFENAAYTTPVGKVSAPFRTQFGYHIVKVLDKRPDIGEASVAQILIATPKSKGEEGIAVAKKRADSIETALKNGASFDDMVKKYSEDKYSVNNNGVLATFGTGRMIPAFEHASFALKTPGEISKPIQTEYGFHIIKLIDKTNLKSYDSMQPQIKKRIENDYRAQVARDAYVQKIKEKNGFREYPENLKAVEARFNRIPDTGKEANTFRASDFGNMNAPLFTLGGKNYTQSDFASYAVSLTRGKLMGQRQTVVKELYSMYVSTVVNDFQEHKLVDENPEFKSLMEEYKAGILLFELMDRNVWGKASKDTVGLQEFYEMHKEKYKWEPGFKGSVYKFKDEATMKEGIKLLAKKGMTDEDMTKKLNTEGHPDAVSIQHGHFEYSRFTEVPQNDIVKGKASVAVKNTTGGYTVVKADELYTQPVVKSLDEARGYVVAEYQDYLEKKWNEQMRSKYPLTVNQPVFDSMVKN